MVRKYVYGEPFETEAVVQLMEAEQGQEELTQEGGQFGALQDTLR